MPRTRHVTLAMLLLLAAPLVWADDDEHHEGEHRSPFKGEALLTLMHNMQYYGHKLGLAIDAGNAKLIDFYVHEVEEVIDAVSEIESYDGIAIPPLLEATLKPKFEELETAIEAGEARRIDAAYDSLLTGCNECHGRAEHPYIVIERNRENPYPQRFEPAR